MARKKQRRAQELLEKPVDWRPLIKCLDLSIFRIPTVSLIDEYHRFLVLKVIAQDQKLDTLKLSPSGLVDHIWHAHLLLPQHYVQVCEMLGGLIEHSVLTAMSDDRSQRYDRTVELYTNIWGRPDAEIWPPASHATQVVVLYQLEQNLLPTDPLSVLVQRCSKSFGIKEEEVRLYLDGRRLDTSLTLAQNHVPNLAHLDLLKAIFGCYSSFNFAFAVALNFFFGGATNFCGDLTKFFCRVAKKILPVHTFLAGAAIADLGHQDSEYIPKAFRMLWIADRSQQVWIMNIFQMPLDRRD